MKIVVLGGAGAMGRGIVRDLAESASDAEILIADFNQDKAEEVKAGLAHQDLNTAFADVRDQNGLALLLKGASVVINSSPYTFNVSVMEAALAADCHYLDLGGLFHVTNKQLELHEQFKQKNLLAVLGMGAAPGLTNVMAAHAAQELEQVDAIDIVIGCVDFVSYDHPFYPPYALDTLLDEYSKEPMVFENGQFKSMPPMSGEIAVDFPEPVGLSHAILTLHSEVATLPLSFKHKGIKNVTFRLGLPPDFHNKLKFLVDLGFAGTTALTFSSSNVSPRQMLSRLIQESIPPSNDPDDCEVVRVDVTGTKHGEPALVRMESIVSAHREWKMSSGTLDTAVPPSIVAQMITHGEIKERGVLPPETCIPAKPLFRELDKRRITIRELVQSPSR